MAKIIYQYAEAEWGEYEMEWPADREWIQNAVFKRGDEFWNGSDGASSFDYWEDETPEHTDLQSKSYISPSTLQITARSEFGFIITFYPQGQSWSVVLTTGIQSEETVEPIISGVEREMFREYCVTKEVAWQVIEYFLNTGKRNPDFDWVLMDVPGNPRRTWEEAHNY